MTNPLTAPPAAADDPEVEARDALDSIGSMLVGTKMMQSQPGVVYSLAAQQAHPADAQAIDSFMQSLDAEKSVNIARAAGTKINLTDGQQAMLRQNGVNYGDVLFTRQDAASDAAAYVEKATGGKQTAKLNADGTLALDRNGDIQAMDVPQHKSDDGWFSSVGSFFGHVGDSLRDGAEGAWHGVMKAYNFTTTEAADAFGHPGNPFDPSNNPIDRQLSADDTEAQDARANGYDPTSFWSMLAFDSSGKKHTSLKGLNDEYGQDKVDEAIRYLNDPTKFRTELESDPNNYTKDASGQTILTPEADAKLTYLASPHFATLAKKIGVKSDDIGSVIVNGLNAHHLVGEDFSGNSVLDPNAHPTAYGISTAGINIAASFAVDPLMVLSKAAKVSKLAAVGVDSLSDAPKAASILTRQSKLPWVVNVQRGWQKAIDLGGEIREANAAGDTVKAAAATARFNAELPGLTPLMDVITGGDRVFHGYGEGFSVVNGVKTPNVIYGASDGLRSLEDAAEFVGSKWGMTRLMTGRAATQSSLMPGALSAFGYRKLKGATAAFMTTRSADRAEGAFQSVLSRADADPALAQKLIDSKMLVRLAPEADDAVLADGTVLAQVAERDPSMLASQSRALALTAAGKGDIALNIRKTGDALGDGSLAGRFGPTAIAARSRLAAQRFTTLLPRSNRIELDDPTAGDKLYKFALTYLNRGDANTVRAAWNVGDGGQRKKIISGLIDQVGHAAGLGKSETGQKILDGAKTPGQSYSAAGSDIVLDGEPIALFEGQTRSQWTLPTFQALQQASAKIGLWEATMGRAMTSTAADTLMSQWKMGALFKPSTTTRNVLEGWLRTTLEGRAGAAMQAKIVATTRNKEFWDRGLDLGSSARKDWEAARAAGDDAQVTLIENSSRLTGQELGRSKTGTRLADSAILAPVGRAYRHMVGSFMDQEYADALLTLGPAELSEALQGYRQQVLASDLGFVHAAADATETAKAGYGPASIRVAVRDAYDGGKDIEKRPHAAWTDQALDGTLGADRFAAALATRVDKNPLTAKAALEYIEDPKLGIGHVVSALEREKKLTGFGTVYFEDPLRAPNIARRAVNDDERLAGKHDWAQKVVDEYTHLLTGQNNQFQTVLADYIKEHGVAPDGEWTASHLVNDARPASMLSPQTMAMPNGGLKSLIASLQDVEGAGYQWMVERPLQRTTTSPIFLANYAIQRKALNKQVEQMVEAGIDREAAENFAKEISIRQSWIKSEQMIDDPGQKSQFDVVARSFFPFSRASQAMIRRWGTGLWQNPVAAQKMMLSYEGAVHSGLIYQDPYGADVFTYPGSGAMQKVMQAVSVIPGFENFSQFPISGDMTGATLMAVPGADNPLRMGMGPMIAFPMREFYKHILPTAYRGDAQKFDAWVNGPIGAGDTTWESLLLPAGLKKLAGFFQTGRDSAMASSMNGAFANLAAAGLVPPPNASPAEIQKFHDRLKNQVRSQLFIRWAFGLFAPAAPSTATEDVAGTGADYAWSQSGYDGLGDEYKAILNETGGDVGRANAVFTALHPDDVVFKDLNHGDGKTELKSSAYETGKSRSIAKGAYLPATEEALQWMNTHGDFVGKYGSVAAYFLPQGKTTGEFSDSAYQAQLELGLRIRKTPEEFMNDVYVKHAESIFYPAVQQFDSRIAAAKAIGNNDLASQLTEQKSQWSKEFRQLNPMFGAKLDDYGPARATALAQLQNLRQMLTDGDVPDGQAKALGQLISTYDEYEQFRNQHPGGDSRSTSLRSGALQMVNDWAARTLPSSGLVPLYNGVFRTLNTNFDPIASN